MSEPSDGIDMDAVHNHGAGARWHLMRLAPAALRMQSAATTAATTGADQ